MKVSRVYTYWQNAIKRHRLKAYTKFNYYAYYAIEHYMDESASAMIVGI